MISNYFKPAVPLVISVVTAETSILLQTVDLSKIFNRGDQTSIEFEIATGATPPGAGRTLTVYAAFSSRGNATPSELMTAAASKLVPIVNLANNNQIYNMPMYEIGSRYLYIWFDHTAMDAGSILTIPVYVNAKTT